MIVSLEECKKHLKIDSDDDDTVVERCMNAGISMVKSMLRVDDFTTFNKVEKDQIRNAIYYAASYLYDFRENKDSTMLDLNLRGMLNTIRDIKF